MEVALTDWAAQVLGVMDIIKSKVGGGRTGVSGVVAQS